MVCLEESFEPAALNLLKCHINEHVLFVLCQVQTWARKATASGFHLVPVPVSPFPDPVGNNVDPFRLPIFIPLNVSSLCPEGSDKLFEGV